MPPDPLECSCFALRTLCNSSSLIGMYIVAISTLIMVNGLTNSISPPPALQVHTCDTRLLMAVHVLRGLNITKYLLYCNGVVRHTLADLKIKYVHRLKKPNGY